MREQYTPQQEVVDRDLEIVPAFLLAGGRGTRLGTEPTPDAPKSLVKVGDKPIIDYVLANLLKNGFKDVHIALGFGARAIEEHIEPWTDHMSLHAHKNTGPGFSSAYIARMVPEVQEKKTRLVVFADVITEAPLDQLVQTHIDNDADITMPVGLADYPATDHVVTTQDVNVVSVARNRSQRQQYSTLRPYFVMERHTLGSEIDEESDIVNDVLPHTLASDGKVVAHHDSNLYLDCGTPERVARAKSLISEMGWLAYLVSIINTVYNEEHDKR